MFVRVWGDVERVPREAARETERLQAAAASAAREDVHQHDQRDDDHGGYGNDRNGRGSDNHADLLLSAQPAET